MSDILLEKILYNDPDGVGKINRNNEQIQAGLSSRPEGNITSIFGFESLGIEGEGINLPNIIEKLREFAPCVFKAVLDTSVPEGSDLSRNGYLDITYLNKYCITITVQPTMATYSLVKQYYDLDPSEETGWDVRGKYKVPLTPTNAFTFLRGPIATRTGDTVTFSGWCKPNAGTTIYENILNVPNTDISVLPKTEVVCLVPTSGAAGGSFVSITVHPNGNVFTHSTGSTESWANGFSLDITYNIY